MHKKTVKVRLATTTTTLAIAAVKNAKTESAKNEDKNNIMALRNAEKARTVMYKTTATTPTTTR